MRCIALTTVDWQGISAFAKQHHLADPLRAVDGQGYKVADPAAFLATLGDNASLVENLKIAAQHEWGRHIHYSFIEKIDDNKNTIIDTLTRSRIVAITKDSQYVIFTGSFCDWYDAIIKICVPLGDPKTKKLLGEVYYFFLTTGLKHCFSRFNEIQSTDGALTLVRAY